METSEEEKDFVEIARVLTWNRRLLSISGIWPLKVSDPLFLVVFVYSCLHATLGFFNLIDYPPTLDHVVTNLTENVAVLMMIAKLTIYRINSESIAQTIVEMKKNLSSESYKTKEEKLAFTSYNRLSLKFIKITIPIITMMTILYTVKGMVPPKIVIDNLTSEYRIPYKIRPIVKPYDTVSYILVSVYHWLAMPIVISAYVGTDCLFASSALHITSQFAVLKCKVIRTLGSSDDCHQGIKQLVLRHLRLIRLAETLEDDFNIYICQQMLGTTFNLCISGFHALVSSAKGETVTFIVFLMYAVILLVTLFVYCYIGECLIEESLAFGETLYLSDWYEISPRNLKMIYICMMRARRPVQLTSAKFFALSLNTFSDILKTSMGYLSVLKTLL